MIDKTVHGDDQYQFKSLFDNCKIVEYLKCNDVKTEQEKNYKLFGENQPSSLKALLDDGKIVEYWTCHETRLELYDNQPDKFIYLGCGYVYEVDGVRQTIYHDIKYHFWKKLF